MFLLRSNENIFPKGCGWPSFEPQYYHCFAERQGTIELHEMTKINPESFQLGPGFEGAHRWRKSALAEEPSAALHAFNKFSIFSVKPILVFTILECWQVKFTQKWDNKRALEHLEFYLTSISIPLPLKMNDQTHVTKLPKIISKRNQMCCKAFLMTLKILK